MRSPRTAFRWKNTFAAIAGVCLFYSAANAQQMPKPLDCTLVLSENQHPDTITQLLFIDTILLLSDLEGAKAVSATEIDHPLFHLQWLGLSGDYVVKNIGSIIANTAPGIVPDTSAFVFRGQNYTVLEISVEKWYKEMNVRKNKSLICVLYRNELVDQEVLFLTIHKRKKRTAVFQYLTDHFH